MTSDSSAAPPNDPGPDFAEGITFDDFGGADLLRGHVGEDAVVLARVGDEVLAVGAQCTHYGGPLDQGIVEGDRVICPWHHACFSLRTGEALGAPAFDPLPCWEVAREGERFFVRAQAHHPPQSVPAGDDAPKDIVIIGGGAAGFSCAEMLRRRGYQGRLAMLSEDADAPCDRPNLSKDYLAGEAPEEWIPLRGEDFYAANTIDLRLGTKVAAIDTTARTVTAADGTVIPFDRLLLATGAAPVRPPIPGADLPHVFTLRSLADSRSIIARAETAKTAVVLGSGFIGLEAAAALRKRGLDVHVVSHGERPLEGVLGRELGDFLRGLHEAHGVVFHMERSLDAIESDAVVLSDGTRVNADLVIIGVGVRPNTALAEAAGLQVDHGILVNPFLETGDRGIYAAGDAARVVDPATGNSSRIEHWVVAERHGQLAAENMFGARVPLTEAPFFWSAHYDVTIQYVGHAVSWDCTEIDGDIAAHDCLVRYLKNDKPVAIAAIGRDLQALEYRRMLG